MVANLSNLRYAKGSRRKIKRIGRGQGSGHGGTSTRGHKGQGSRSGSGYKRAFEGGQMPLSRRLPKFGFHNPFRTSYSVVNVEMLEKLASDGRIKDAVTPEILHAIGIIAKKGDLVKVLGSGELKTKLSITAHKFSKTAVEKITAAGGTATPVAVREQAPVNTKSPTP